MDPLRRLVSAGVVSVAMAASAAAQDGDQGRLDDAGTRLQFDYYVADLPALERDLAAVERLEVGAAMLPVKHVYRGFGAWKQAELLAGRDAEGAARAARSCAQAVEQALVLDPQRAALFAMLSACQRLTAALEGRIKAPLAATRARQSLERAIAMAPRDPHVLLMTGTVGFQRAMAEGGGYAAARSALQAAVAAFEARARSPQADSLTAALGWGAAEAWNLLGRIAVLEGDAVAARDAFERAIGAAGEYRDAEERLAALISGRPPAVP